MALTKEQNKYLLDSYNSKTKSVKEAICSFKEKFGFLITYNTVLMKWKGHEFELNSHGGHRCGLTTKEFKKLYNSCKGNIGFMKKETGYKTSSLVSRCKRHNLEPKNIPKYT